MKIVSALILCLCLAVPVAAQPHAAIDFTQALSSPSGQPVINGDAKPPAPFTLGDAVVNALEATIDEDRNRPGVEKFKMDALARKVIGNKAAELTVEEIAMIKERIGKVYGPQVVGATWRLLDPAQK